MATECACVTLAVRVTQDDARKAASHGRNTYSFPESQQHGHVKWEFLFQVCLRMAYKSGPCGIVGMQGTVYANVRDTGTQKNRIDHLRWSICQCRCSHKREPAIDTTPNDDNDQLVKSLAHSKCYRYRM